MENAEIAHRLEQVTGLLEAQRANPSGWRRTTALQWVLGHFNKHLADIGREQGARPPELETKCRRRCELW